MSLTITATAGSASANSFVTEAEVIAYMATRLNASAWTTVTGATCTEDEKKALIEATREISTLAGRCWIGQRTDSTQALAWPRFDAVNPDDPTQSYFDTTEIPQRVKDATCELAFQFLKAGTTDVAAADASAGIKRKQVDVLATEYLDPRERPDGLARYPRVLGYLAPLSTVASGPVFSVVRG